MSTKVTKKGGKKRPVDDNSAPKPRPETSPSDDTIAPSDLLTIVTANLAKYDIASHHINSMNSLCGIGIRNIITEVFGGIEKAVMIADEIGSVSLDKNNSQAYSVVSFKVEYLNTKIEKPSTIKYKSRSQKILLPGTARTNDLNYSASVSVDIKVTSEAQDKDGNVVKGPTETLIKDFRIGSIPVIVGSQLCHTYNMPREVLINIGEDPNDHGGYFIAKGNEKSINSLENIINNYPQTYKNMYQNEIARVDIISKPGDGYENSFNLILRYLDNGGITMEIKTNKLLGIEIPFFIVYRLFGMTSDVDIFDNIMYGINNKDAISNNLLNILTKAMRPSLYAKDWRDGDHPVINSRDRSVIIDLVNGILNANIVNKNHRRNENIIKFMQFRGMSTLDAFILPHIGAGEAARVRKLKFFSFMIRKLLLVATDVIPGTDRDHFKYKRMHGAGTSLAKTFKTRHNLIINRPIVESITKAFKSTHYDKVDPAIIIKTTVKPDDMEKYMFRSITDGNKTTVIKQNKVSNRLDSQMFTRKNDTNIKSISRTVTSTNSSATRQNTRADEMRRVHPSAFGFICCIQSPDAGENVGKTKQMAISASITEATNSQMLVDMLLANKDVVDLDLVAPSSVSADALTIVFVNGYPVGYTSDGVGLAKRYREHRRSGKIHPHTSVVWEELQREVYLWVDVGRLIRPLLIVYNNIDEWQSGKSVAFHQGLRLTKTDIINLRLGRIDVDDLQRRGIIEYITPEEQTNLLIAPNITALTAGKADYLHQYTHCEIEQTVLGLIALGSPYANFTSPNRCVLYTSHKKSSCGWYSFNWPERTDKNTYLQYYCKNPIVQTYADTVAYPSSDNVIIAIGVYGGSNQEDSIIINKSSCHRGLGLLTRFYTEKVELESNEVCGNLIIDQTTDIKSGANYEKLENGIIKVGSIVKKNDVIVSKYLKIPKPTDPRILYADRSVVYKNDEESVVVGIVYDVRNEDDKKIVKIKMQTHRSVKEGDKMASRHGNKGVIGELLPACDMPFTEDGLVPDLIINPHSIPTRMSIGQLIEMTMYEYACREGRFVDGTVFYDDTNVAETVAYLEKRYGITFGGKRTMYNGKTGEVFDTLIFIGGNTYMRMQKFSDEDSRAIGTGMMGPTMSAMTRQPVSGGKNNNGSMRLGEMEIWVKAAHGAGLALNEKLYETSNGIKIPMCRRCGRQMIVNVKNNIYKCVECGNSAIPTMVHSDWTTNIANHFYKEICIDTVYQIDPPGFETE